MTQAHGLGNPAPPTSGLAIASLVLSIVWVSILGVIFGHIALRQIQRGEASGNGLAVAGLVVGYVGVAGHLLWFVPLMVAVVAGAAAGGAAAG